MKQKKKFDVYYVGSGYGCYAEDYSKEYVGSTWAVSSKQACNNLAYRTGRHPEFVEDWYGEGWISFDYEAVEVEG